jgi:DNA polymerase III epsilon subunit-like protein
MRYVVIDIEASGFDGFPIEIGWCDQDGKSESYLIRPAWNWTDWDIRAERIHGISREDLADRGEPFDAVAILVANMLARSRKEGTIVASDNPDFDRAWLVMLLRRANIEDHVTLANILELYAAAVEPLFAALDEGKRRGAKADPGHALFHGNAIIQACKAQVAVRPKHRAADDARRLRDIVEMIKAEVIKAITQEGRR